MFASPHNPRTFCHIHHLTVHPEPRSNNFENYYVASFGFETLPASDREQLTLVAAE
jgi:hypothetical protein